MSGRPDASQVFVFGPFELRAEDGSLWRDGKRVPLPPRAADVLLVLLQKGGQLVGRAELKALWGLPSVEDSSLNYQVHVIRHALRDGFETDCIETVRHRGFRFLPSVTVRAARWNGPEPVVTATGGFDPPAGLPGLLGQARSDRQDAQSRAGHRWRMAIGLSAVTILLAGMLRLLAPSEGVELSIEAVETLTHDSIAKSPPLIVDDARVYFREMRDIHAWHSVPIAGGASALVFDRASTFRLTDVKREGTEYLVLKEGRDPDLEVWALSRSTGAIRRVGSARCNSAAWSPDGVRIACASAGSLQILNADGVAIRQLVPEGLGNPTHVRWSPDGSRLRLTISEPTDDGIVNRLWEVGDDGVDLRPLFSDGVDRCCGDWTPDGRHYIFEATENGGTQLFARTEPRGWFGRRAVEVTKLTHDARSYHAPRVGHDGRTVYVLGADPGGELVHLDPVSRRFAIYLPGVSGTWLTFSPDRRWIAYVGYPDKQLWRARADGSDRRRLTSSVFDVDASVWSPDGRWIAFLRRTEGGPLRVHLIPSEGGEPAPIGGTNERTQGAPSWSPDGTKLIFGEVPTIFGQPSGDEALHEYDLRQGALRTIPGSAGLWSPRWSPDGRYIAATTILGRAIRLLDTRTGRWEAMSVSSVDHMTWSSDSRSIHYHTEGTTYALRRVRVEDRVVEELADLRHMPIAAYWWSGLTPDDEPLLLRRRGGTEIHAVRLRIGRR